MDRNLLIEAEKFVRSCHQELKKSEQQTLERMKQIQAEVASEGFYEHTYEELEYGAKVAWRNSNRCIGRFFWDSLSVKDRRDVQREEQIFSSLLEHIEYATNGGKIRPTITIFPPMSGQQRIRIWNHQLIRYAGYETEQGIIGDSDSLAFTKACIELGWEPKYGRFDLLPIVIQINEEPPKLFDIPEELVLEVPIHHPHYEWFKDLHLKWYAVPIISSMSLEIGGITYTAAPFNGWYMGTEIGARNLADEARFNMLPQIGNLMGLDIKSNSSLWKDRALLELNTAVLFSFKEAGVSIVDHHTAAQQFRRFEEREAEASRQVTGNWAWLIPPMSPAATHIYHKPYKNEIKRPNYFYQKNPF